jgi:solute carrier family 25 (mitochondrial S-adenosylmethionine transporter), member 26
VAAFTIDILVYPLDTIKTRYQSQGFLAAKSRASSRFTVPYTAVKGLYQGIGSVVLATLPAGEPKPKQCPDVSRTKSSSLRKLTAAIFFASYESAKSLLKHTLPTAIPDPAIHGFASAGAEMASCLVLTPAEVVKQNAQVLPQPGSSRFGRSSSLRALRMLWGSEGGVGRTLLRGYTALVARNLPFTAMHFPMFEYLRGQIWEWRQNQAHSLPALAAAGSTTGNMANDSLRSLLIETGFVTGGAAAVSGSLAATITTPADVVKTRIMLGAKDASNVPSGQHTRSPNVSGLAVARAVIQESGIRGLFRGGMLRAAWAAMGSGLYLGSYEATKVWLKRRSVQKLS